VKTRGCIQSLFINGIDFYLFNGEMADRFRIWTDCELIGVDIF
jgi:hypothetical protein